MESKERKKLATVVVATINGVDILASHDDSGFVPIRPICELFGIASNKQIENLKENPLFNSRGTLRVSVAADGREREMYCLPVEYLFGWMLGVNSANVKPEVREKLLEYQNECIAVLKEHYFGKFRMREKSMEKSAKLEVEKQTLISKKDMSDDLKRYLEITKEQKNEQSNRAKSSRSVLTGLISLFSDKEMTGQ